MVKTRLIDGVVSTPCPNPDCDPEDGCCVCEHTGWVAAAHGEAITDGFFWCKRCRAVKELSEGAVESALSMPAGSLARLKCPGCHHYAVEWKVASVERPRTADGRVVKRSVPVPVDPARASELWRQVYASLNQ